MRWLILPLLLAAAAGPVRAQELYLLGGEMQKTNTHDRSYSWQIEYLEGLGEHAAVTLSYLNEGHVPDHHRDGIAAQLWGRTNLFDRRLSLAVGIGPYYFFDTTGARPDGSFKNDHGVKGMATFAATWYTESRVLFQLRTNWVGVGESFNSLSAVAGMGFQLDPPATPGPIPKEPPSPEKTTDNEITVYGGRTIVNSFSHERSLAMGIEYRRGLFKHLDCSVGWLYEGDNRLLRRNGLTAELWAVRDFFDKRLMLGIGGGAYFALDHYGDLFHGKGTSRVLSGLVSLTGSYRFLPDWDLRTTFHRVVTNYDRDTDVFLGGIGYRF